MKFFIVFCVALLATIDAHNIPAYELEKASERLLLNRDLHFSSVVDIDRPMEQEPFKTPEFCHDLDCPAYTVINKTDNYELREYQESRWVTTDKLNMDYDAASRVMFMRLFDYIQGENEKKMKIAMTAPVIVRVIPGQGPACENNFTMSFFIAPKVKSPPAPTDKTVHITTLLKHRVFVSQFGGRESGQDWIDHGTTLAENLLKDNRKFDHTFFYTAGYDSPFRLLFRHNEIWFMSME